MARARRAPSEGPVEVTATVRTGPPVAEVAAWTRRIRAAAGARRRPLSVLLCGDGRMRALNRRWRRIDRPTDVLSFPSGEPGPLGDLVVDVPYAARQARRLGHPLAREVQILLAHGVLHLLGHDHETDDGTMFALQRRLVLRLFGDGPDGVPEGEMRTRRRGGR